MSVFRRIALVGGALLLALPVQAAWPEKPVRIVLPYAAGGGADFLTRVLAQKLQEKWGQPVVVDNKPGAGATIGTDIAAKAAPDGYTLLMTASTMAVSPSAHPNLPYDVLKDFSPITPVAQSAFMLTLRASLPADTVAALVALAKAKPGTLNFGTAGAGTMSHLSIELFKARTGIAFEQVAYKGSNPAMNALLAGEIDAVMDTPAAVMAHVQSGKLRALAVTTPARSPSVPDVPTMAEAGIADCVVTVWFGLLAPAKTPASVIAQIHADTLQALAIPDVGRRFATQGLEIVTMTPPEFAMFIRAEVDKWGAVVRAAKIKFE